MENHLIPTSSNTTYRHFPISTTTSTSIDSTGAVTNNSKVESEVPVDPPVYSDETESTFHLIQSGKGKRKEYPTSEKSSSESSSLSSSRSTSSSSIFSVEPTTEPPLKSPKQGIRLDLDSIISKAEADLVEVNGPRIYSDGGDDNAFRTDYISEQIADKVGDECTRLGGPDILENDLNLLVTEIFSYHENLTAWQLSSALSGVIQSLGGDKMSEAHRQTLNACVKQVSQYCSQAQLNALTEELLSTMPEAD